MFKSTKRKKKKAINYFIGSWVFSKGFSLVHMAVRPSRSNLEISLKELFGHNRPAHRSLLAPKHSSRNCGLSCSWLLCFPKDPRASVGTDNVSYAWLSALRWEWCQQMGRFQCDRSSRSLGPVSAAVCSEVLWLGCVSHGPGSGPGPGPGPGSGPGLRVRSVPSVVPLHVGAVHGADTTLLLWLSGSSLIHIIAT